MAERLVADKSVGAKKTSSNAMCLPFPRVTSPAAVLRAQCSLGTRAKVANTTFPCGSTSFSVELGYQNAHWTSCCGTVDFHTTVTHRGCGQKLGLPESSSCIPTKTESEPLSSPAHCSRSSASCGRQELFSEGDQDGHAGRQKSVGLLAAQAVDELLNRAKRSVVFLALLLQKREWDTELCMQSICAVPHDR